MIAATRLAPLSLLALLLAGCGGGPDDEGPPIRPVRAMRVGDLEELSGRRLPGRAKATQEVNLSFRVGGPLISLAIDVGQKVSKDDVLANIDPKDFEVDLRNVESQLARADAEIKAMRTGARPEEIEKLRAEVQKAEAALELAKKEVENYTEAVKRNAAAGLELARKKEAKERYDAQLRTARENLRIGETGARVEDIEAKEAEIRSLQAAVDSARDALSYTILRAPYDGVIAAKYVENYETVLPRQSILRLLDNTKIEMVVQVPESMIALAPHVKEIFCVFDAFKDRPIPASLKEIGTEASETTRTYPVTLIMDQPEDFEVLPGMSGICYGRAEHPEGIGEEGITIPLTALIDQGEGRGAVWIIDEQSGKTSRREVRLGALSTGGIKVLDLELGLVIATAGVHRLSEGQQVRILGDG